MSSYKKKAGVSILLLGLVVVAVGGYVGMTSYQKHQAQKAAEEEANNIVYVTEIGDPVALTYRRDTTEYSFQKIDDKNWELLSDPDFPVKDFSISSLANFCANLPVEQTLTEHDDLSDYGLQDPAVTVNIIDADGNEAHVSLGRQTATEDQFYLSVQGDDNVYIVSNEINSRTPAELFEIMDYAKLPYVKEDCILAVSATVDGEQKIGDASNGDLRNIAKSLNSIDPVAYKPIEEEWAEYGITDTSNTITIKYKLDTGEEEEHTVTIGYETMDDQTDAYFARIDQIDQIVYMKAESIERILSLL